MPYQPVPFATNSYEDRSLPVSAQRLVNLYPEAKPQDAKSPIVLYNTPGQKAFATLPTNIVRGTIAFNDTHIFVVAGDTAYTVNDAGGVASLGFVNGTAPVSMASNGSQVAIVTETEVYTATTTAIAANPSIVSASGVGFLDGMGIFSTQDDRLFVTGFNDFDSIDPLDFTRANAVPDQLVGLKVANREVWAFGRFSVQVYYNSGQGDFPLSPIPSGIIQRGCFSGASIAEYQGTLLWLGDDKRVYMNRGYIPQSVSTQPIERQIASFVSPETATGTIYEQQGHIFYILTFDEGTFVYDLTTQLWHERETFGQTNWSACCAVAQFGSVYVGDTTLGFLYELDLDTFTDRTSTTIQRIATAPPIHGQGNRVAFHKLYLDMETGVGSVTDPGIAMLDWSDDGGFTYGSSHWRSFGLAGQRLLRVIWNRLGSAFQRTFRVTISSACRIAIIRAYLDAEVDDQ